MIEGFKNFLLRGNIVDLAVAVIIGAAFNAVVDSLVKDIITPIIGMVFGSPDFSGIKLGAIGLGSFLNAVIAFLIKAAAVYFLVVVPFQAIMARLTRPAAAAEILVPEDVKLLAEIRDLLAKQVR